MGIQDDKSETMFPGPCGLGDDRGEEEQITVWPVDASGCVQVWMENEDGECSFQLSPAERRWLIERLQRGL